MHSEGYSSCRVCLSIKRYLTSGASVCPEKSATYSAGKEGQKFVVFSLKLHHSRGTALPALYSYCAVGHFLLAEYVHVLLKCHVGAGFGQ